MFNPTTVSLIGNVASPAVAYVTYLLGKKHSTELSKSSVDTKDFETLNVRISSLESRNDDLARRNDELSAENSILRGRNLELADVIREKSNQLSAATERITELSANVALLNSRHDDLFNLIKGLQKN
jgi:cell division protein FtsB